MTERLAVTYVEIDVSYCALIYGQAPCTAALGVTGDIKCFNTPGTCQDRDNYSNTPVTLRFAMPANYRQGIEAIPSITDVSYRSAEIEPGRSLGSRSEITITFKDHPHSDAGPGFDKYVSERDYDPYQRGTFWAKFRARQPYLKGEPLRWYQGFEGQALGEMECRHFIIESFDGPTPDGVFTIKASDPLRLLYGRQANAPKASTGYLQTSITNSATSATLSPSGVGNAEYPASGHINIGGKEIVSFTRSGNSLTLTRGQQGTTGVAHDANERMQLCRQYSAQDAADIIHDLLTTYVPGFDPDWIDLDDWQAETGAYLKRLYTAFIAEPTPVYQLVEELIEQCGLVIWWDDLAQKIRLQVLRPIPVDAAVYDNATIQEETFRPEDQPNLRLSQVWVSFAQTNPLRGMDEDNFRQHQLNIVPDGTPGDEADYGEPAIHKVYSRWIPLGGSFAAERTGQLLLSRYVNPPRRFLFGLFRGAQAMPQIGDGCLIEARVLQDATGATERVPAQVVAVEPSPEGWRVVAIEMRFAGIGDDDLDNRVITLGGNLSNVNLREIHDQLFPAPVAGDQVTVIVQSGAVVGSVSTALPAFDVGDWPSTSLDGTRTNGSAVITGLSSTTGFVAGMFVRGTGIPNGAKIASVDSGSQITLDQNATSSGTSSLTVYLVRITLELRGRFQGKGGAGGKGGRTSEGRQGKPGLPGGTALYLRYPVDLILTTGAPRVWGGGGGGGGAGVLNFSDHRGGSGGGAADTGAGGPKNGNGEAGSDGTLDAGGIGGNSYASWAWSQWPHMTGVRGGTGGNPGQIGGTGGDHGGGNGGAGGAAGAAIDGVSFAKKTGSGDIRGPEIN